MSNSKIVALAKKREVARISAPLKQRNLWSDAFRRLLRNRLSMIGFFIFALFLMMAILGPILAPYPYMLQDLNAVAQPPSAAHWMGTDDLGRDFFSRILWGAQTAAIVAFASTFSSLLLGMIIGSAAAFVGGLLDWGASRLTDVIMAVPDILFASLLAATVREPVGQWVEEMYIRTGFSFLKTTTYVDFIVVFSALSFVHWTGYARLIRGQILSLREKEYVEAARMVGVKGLAILVRHVVPNALGPILVSVTFGFAGAIVAESSLSYLGIGVQPPQASWGAMINDNALSWRYRPWLTIIPGMVVGIVSLAINFLGDGLMDALNPRQAGRA